MSDLININIDPVKSLLPTLLKDMTTGKNIIWATDTFRGRGEGFSDRQQMEKSILLANTDVIRPRVVKSIAEQQARTRKKAEVYTPVWICDQMNNYCDEDWFGRKDVFNVLHDDHTWDTVKEKIEFPEGKSWKQYVDSRRLEITCGEAPFLVSRYDAATGEMIEPPKHRIGILDRKLRIVSENTDTKEEWIKWATRAVESVYGYEFQGDNLLIARCNILLTFCDFYRDKWGSEPDKKLLRVIANRIVWNIWQMDGLKDTVPLGKPQEAYHQMTFTELLGEEPQDDIAPLCVIKKWRSEKKIIFHELKEK